MKYDFIIIGGGTAGCILANRLSANRQHSVLLIEAGNKGDSLFVHLPAGQSQVVGNKKWDWQFQAEPDDSCHRRAFVWPAGKCLGGGSAINGMVYVRGNRLDYDHWEALGNRGWSYKDVLPYFKKIETYQSPNLFRGNNGLLNVREVIAPHCLTNTFINAASQLQVPVNPDYNGEEQEGAGLCQTNQTLRLRDSTAHAYLKPALHRDNLTVMTKALVHRIHFDGKKARRVSVQCDDSIMMLEAKKEIILCAGSINSPKLLLQSGIGPAHELLTDCIHHLNGVGKNLQEHPNTWLSYFVNVSTYNTDLNPWRGMQHLWQWLVKGGGAIATPIAHAVCFVKTKNELAQPDIQIHFTPFSYELNQGKLSLTKKPAIVLTPNICRPKTRGYLRLRDTNPETAPIISYQALREQDDIETLLAGCRFARRLVETSAFQPFVIEERLPGKKVQTDDEWYEYIRSHASLGYHPVGTCKMGHDDNAVVDSHLKVHGILGLRVVDASIMPVITSGNTNAPTMMIAEKAADFILKDYC